MERQIDVTENYSDEAMLAEIRRVAAVLDERIFMSYEFERHSQIPLGALFPKIRQLAQSAGARRFEPYAYFP